MLNDFMDEVRGMNEYKLVWMNERNVSGTRA